MQAQICLWVNILDMENEFLIPLNGLNPGMNEFRWEAGIEFFRQFENAEILDAEVIAEVSANKNGREIEGVCRLGGKVTVQCDRCMEDLVLPVFTRVDFEVAYGGEKAKDCDEDGKDMEILYVRDGETDLDMSQLIYDYVCLSLPMQRYHREGECNEEAMKRLQHGVTTAADGADSQAPNPFAALKGLFE